MADSGFWRELRKDFESLGEHDFSIEWSSAPPIHSTTSRPMESQWSCFRFPDASLGVQFEAMATRGAKALGLDSMDDWLDQMRLGGFVPFTSGGGHITRVDGKVIHFEGGPIEDLVKHSMTLCFKLEAEAMDNRRFEHMPPEDFRTMQFWLNLKAQFLSISDQETLSAYYGLATGSWHLHANLSDDETARRLECAFEHLANRAAIMLGIASDRDPLDAWPTWLDRLKEAGPHFVRVRATTGDGDPITEDETGRITHVVLASAEYCDVLATRALQSSPADRPVVDSLPECVGVAVSKQSKIGRNIERLMGNCGWSQYELAERTGLDKKSVFGHIRNGVRPSPKNLKVYADALTKGLGRPIQVEDLKS